MRGPLITCGVAGMLALVGCEQPVMTPTGAIAVFDADGRLVASR